MKYYFKALEKYFDFEGRASRSEYWYFALFNFLITIILSIFLNDFGGIDFSAIYTVLTLIPSIAVAVRRMHDVGKSGWYALIPIYSLILVLTDSDSGSNEYGENPNKQ